MMDFKKFSFNIVLNVLIFTFVASFFAALQLPADLAYYIAALILIGIAVEVYLPILRFLTLPINIITLVISVTLILTAVFYIFELLMPEFYVNGIAFDSQSFTIITIESFVLSDLVSMILISFTYSVAKGFIEWMRSNC
ncbi:hypothetical protein GF357_00705 [Candidatus Dojkabacteria bacterium]|nr:hypothetical protein [Candidatus Dojkabacteria bacterium]